jgi:hypothetical protein
MVIADRRLAQAGPSGRHFGSVRARC